MRGGNGLGWRGQLKPKGSRAWQRARSDRFSQTCPFSPIAADEDQIAAELFPRAAHGDPQIGRYDAAYVGHALEPGFRERGSSGGMVSWVAAELLRRGLVDGIAHVAPADPQEGGRLFHYHIARDPAALMAGAQSRYYPVELSGVLREMREVPGRYAVVGIPCFIKAVHLARRSDPLLRDRIAFTLGLVCGHMKSRHMVDSFALQMGIDPDDVASIDYRVKNPALPANWYTARITRRDGQAQAQDWWHLVDGDWGSGFFQNTACDYCDDVVAETADISFGDAWIEPYSSDGQGTNVVIVRSPLVHRLLRQGVQNGRVALRPVDAALVAETQAAGFRQRREGLGYRLTWHKQGVRPLKRVAPGKSGIRWRRKLLYRMRHWISRGSAHMFRVARLTGRAQLFLLWGRAMLTLYHGIAYSRGRLGRILDRMERLPRW
jgi:coenzyme F420-reducing hydrogenase beta subunit